MWRNSCDLKAFSTQFYGHVLDVAKKYKHYIKLSIIIWNTKQACLCSAYRKICTRVFWAGYRQIFPAVNFLEVHVPPHTSNVCMCACGYTEPMCRLLLLASVIYETTEFWKEFSTVHLLLRGSLWADSSLTNTSTISTYCLLHLHLMATLQCSDYEKTVINIFTQFAYMSQTLPNLDEDTNAGGAQIYQIWRSNVILNVVQMWVMQQSKVHLDGRGEKSIRFDVKAALGLTASQTTAFALWFLPLERGCLGSHLLTSPLIFTPTQLEANMFKTLNCPYVICKCSVFIFLQFFPLHLLFNIPAFLPPSKPLSVVVYPPAACPLLAKPLISRTLSILHKSSHSYTSYPHLL